MAELKKLDQADSYKYYRRFLALSSSGKKSTANQNAAKNRSFYYGDQWTDAEVTKNEDRGQYVVTINRTKKYIDGLVGLLTAEIPTFKILPFGTEDNEMSQIANRAAMYVFNTSHGRAMLNRIVKFGAVDDISYAYVKQNDTNKTCFEFQQYSDVCVDIDTTDPFFTDASVIYITKWANIEDVVNLYNIPKGQLQTDVPKTWHTNVSSDGTRTEVDRIVDLDKMYVKLIEGTHREVQKVFKDEGGRQIATGEIRVRFIRRTLIGYNYLFEEELDSKITTPNIVPFYCEDTANIYKLGAVHFIKETQRLLNKSFGIMLLNAQLSSNPKLLVYEDSIPSNSMKEFKANYNKPGSINILAGDGKDTVAPITISGQPIAGAWYSIVTMMMQEMEFASMPNMLLGMDASQGNTKSDTFKNYEMMLTSLRSIFVTYEGFFSALGKSVLQHFFAYTDKTAIARVVGADKIMAELQELADQGLNIEDPQSVEKFRAENKGIDDIAFSTIVKKATRNLKYLDTLQAMLSSTDFTDYDIVVEKGTYLPSYSSLKFFMKYELYTQGLIDNQTVLEDLPLENRDEIIERVSEINQLSGKVRELTAQNEEYEKSFAAMQQKVVDGKVDLEVIKAKAATNKSKNDFVQKGRSDRAIQNNAFRTKVSSTVAEIEQEGAKAILDLEKQKNEYNLLIKQLKGDNKTKDGKFDLEGFIAEAFNQSDNS